MRIMGVSSWCVAPMKSVRQETCLNPVRFATTAFCPQAACLWYVRGGVLAVRAGHPGNLGDFNAFIGQRVRVIDRGFARNAQPVAYASMDTGGFLGELVTDIVAAFLDLAAQPLHYGAHMIGHPVACDGHRG